MSFSEFFQRATPTEKHPDGLRPFGYTRRRRDLEAAPDGGEIEAIEPVERAARTLQAMEPAVPLESRQSGQQIEPSC